MPRPGPPLSPTELERLERRIAEIGHCSVPHFHGVVAAAICHPSPEVLPSRWLPLLTGDHAFEDQAEVEGLYGLILRYYNSLGSQLKGFEPHVPTDEDELAEWCRGYLQCYGLDPWLEQDEIASALGGILFCAGRLPDDDQGSQRKKFRELFDDGLHGLVVHSAIRGAELFQAIRDDERRAFQQGGVARRKGPKVGRNDPCPCRSGRKFKRCCAN